jgi:hypothetical protein
MMLNRRLASHRVISFASYASCRVGDETEEYSHQTAEISLEAEAEPFSQEEGNRPAFIEIL